MTDNIVAVELGVADQLAQIFPNLSPEIINISIKHPSNRIYPLTVASLIQSCIDDLLEQRTYTEKLANSVESTSSSSTQANSSYRTSYVINSDDSDEDIIGVAKKVEDEVFHDLTVDNSQESDNSIIITGTTAGSDKTVRSSVCSKPSSILSPAEELKNKASTSPWKDWRKNVFDDIEPDNDLPKLFSPSSRDSPLKASITSEGSLKKSDVCSNRETPVLSMEKLLESNNTASVSSISAKSWNRLNSGAGDIDCPVSTSMLENVSKNWTEYRDKNNLSTDLNSNDVKIREPHSCLTEKMLKDDSSTNFSKENETISINDKKSSFNRKGDLVEQEGTLVQNTENFKDSKNCDVEYKHLMKRKLYEKKYREKVVKLLTAKKFNLDDKVMEKREKYEMKYREKMTKLTERLASKSTKSDTVTNEDVIASNVSQKPRMSLTGDNIRPTTSSALPPHLPQTVPSCLENTSPSVVSNIPVLNTCTSQCANSTSRGTDSKVVSGNIDVQLKSSPQTYGQLKSSAGNIGINSATEFMDHRSRTNAQNIIGDNSPSYSASSSSGSDRIAFNSSGSDRTASSSSRSDITSQNSAVNGKYVINAGMPASYVLGKPARYPENMLNQGFGASTIAADRSNTTNLSAAAMSFNEIDGKQHKVRSLMNAKLKSSKAEKSDKPCVIKTNSGCYSINSSDLISEKQNKVQSHISNVSSSLKVKGKSTSTAANKTATQIGSNVNVPNVAVEGKPDLLGVVTGVNQIGTNTNLPALGIGGNRNVLNVAFMGVNPSVIDPFMVGNTNYLQNLPDPFLLHKDHQNHAANRTMPNPDASAHADVKSDVIVIDNKKETFERNQYKTHMSSNIPDVIPTEVESAEVVVMSSNVPQVVETPEVVIITPPKPEVVKTPEMIFEDMKQQVLMLFPDVDPNYLTTMLQHEAGPVAVNNVCNHLLEVNYPKVKHTPVPMVTVGSETTQSLSKKSYTKNYYTDYSGPVTDYVYRNQCETVLQNEFKWISVKDIRKFTAEFNGHYAPMHQLLRFVMKKRQDEAGSDCRSHSEALVHTSYEIGNITKEVRIKFLKCARPFRRLSSIVPALQEEMDFVADKILEQAQEDDRVLAAEINEHEYEETGQLIECGCCYGEVPFENMVQCYEGHLFCQDCLKNYAKESVFGQGKADLLCMTEGCDAQYPVSQLSKALPSNILEKYEDRVKEENINLADLADLVRCPHCDFAALMDPGDKVFTCQNITCMKETCRYCKEGWSEHFGKRCEEIEKKDETKLRTEFEEKMTEAKIRTCHRCKARFTKLEGCNRMTCRCGAKMCYICRKPNIDYNHFCQHVRNPGMPCDKCQDCSLWSNPEEDEKRAIEEIRKQANEARIEKGYTEDKYIGAKDDAVPPPKKQRVG